MISHRLKELREQKKMSQKELAQALQLSPQRYNYYERGMRYPDWMMLVTIADFYGVTLDYLVGRTVQPQWIRMILINMR